MEFNFWFCCDSEAGYLCELNKYLRRTESTEYNLGESAVLNIETSLNDSCCTLVVGEFFFSSNLIKTLFEKNTFVALRLSKKQEQHTNIFTRKKLQKR